MLARSDSFRLSISTECSIVEVSFYGPRPFSFTGEALGHFSAYEIVLSQRHSADGLIDTRSDWTWGCISLKNADVDEIYAYLSHGSIVEILP